MNLREIDLNKLNSMTKYPSIPTYHQLGEKGRLTEGYLPFEGKIYGTEKVDGTNSRIVLTPGPADRPRPRYLLGSREDLLYAEGDLIGNPALGIVEALRPIADRLVATPDRYPSVLVFYFETYGGRVTAASKQYTSQQGVGLRLFDVAAIGNYEAVLRMDRAEIANWREQGGQHFLSVPIMETLAELHGLEKVPSLFEMEARELPTGLQETHAFLKEKLPRTQVALDEGAGGRPEGIVVRTLDRKQIAKLRFEDYERTLRK